MIDSADEFLRLRTSDIRDDYLRSANEEASESTWKDIIAKFPEMRKWVAHNKTIPESVIELLSDDLDSEVLAFIARKRKTPEHILSKLAHSQHENVRLAVVYNPKISNSILEGLLKDSWIEVRQVAEKRLNESA